MDIGGIRTIERKDIYEPLVLKVLSERGIDRCAKVVVADETLADDIVVDARNECRLSRVCLAGRLVDKADAILVSCRRAPIFPFGRRDAPGIDIAVCASARYTPSAFRSCAGTSSKRNTSKKRPRIASLRTYSASALRSFANSRWTLDINILYFIYVNCTKVRVLCTTGFF